MQRQRIGNSFARVTASPGPELRFRIETKLPQKPSLSTLNSQRSTSYVPLNVHSYYSFLDSTLSPRAVVELAKRYELSAIALTDHNNLHGAVEFAQLAAAAGIKPIIGAELDCHGRRICLYAQNQKGYQNLCRILNRQSGADRAAASRKQTALGERSKVIYKAPTASRPMDFSEVDTEGLLAVSSVAEWAQFFPERFYLQTNNREAFEKRVSSLPCVVALPVHYELPADRWKYDIIQSIRTLTLLRQQHPEKRLAGQYHFRSALEMRKLVAAHPELLAHSVELAERCSFTIQPGLPQFPRYTPTGSTPVRIIAQTGHGRRCRRYPAKSLAQTATGRGVGHYHRCRVR